MNQLLQKFQELENTKEQLFAQLRKKKTEELYYKSTESSWSIIQALHHTMNAEKLATDYIIKKIKGINSSPKTGFKTSIRYFLLRLALKSPLKFKAPKALPEPPNNETLETIILQWNTSRSILQELLKNFPAEHENKEVFKNLIAGKLNINQALGWMKDHFDHHLLQIERINSSYKNK